MSIWDNYRISEYLIHCMILADFLTTNVGFFSFDLQALLIYVDKIFHPVVAVILSITFVLAFGEVIPQAICSRYGLYVGSNFVGLVQLYMC
ncbi:hypothetical protein AHAS_Ahas14G0123000 [Arachis hypogaea]